MTLSLLQLNINADNFWDTLIEYLNTHDFDIVFLQEVCGENTILGNINCKRDSFAELQKILAPKYQGELAIAERFTSSPTSYMGNAIFYKKEFHLQKKTICTMYERTTPFPCDATSFEDEGRALLHLTLSRMGEELSFLTTHFAWAKTPNEHPHQTQQGEILLNYLKTVPHPFVLAGDFNLDANQPTIKKIGELAQNLITTYEVPTTINPRLHRVKNLSVAVDYIFVTEGIEVKNFRVIEDDLSDHYGVTATIEV